MTLLPTFQYLYCSRPESILWFTYKEFDTGIANIHSGDVIRKCLKQLKDTEITTHPERFKRREK